VDGDHVEGQLKVGMLADVAVLSQDIFTVAADKLPATTSVYTIVDGKTPVAMLPSRHASDPR
jgi:predicted amidohydrolase YtcJ